MLQLCEFWLRNPQAHGYPLAYRLELCDGLDAHWRSYIRHYGRV